MSVERLVIDGYGQVELNQVAFRRDGRIEAQLPLDPTDFATAKAENGMLLAVDRVAGTIRMPDAAEDKPIALNYSSEHLYDERALGLKNFYLDRNTFLPRLGYLSVGDKFTTNCISYNTSSWADETALKAAIHAYKTTAVYGGIGLDGSILLSATKPSVGPVLQVIKETTMPDGQYAVKFQVIAD